MSIYINTSEQVENDLPSLFALALPHLPVQFRKWTIQLLFVLRILSSLLDQTAIAVFGIGILIWIAGVFNVVGIREEGLA